YVYLLQNKARDAFKIGVSLEPARRGAQLPQELDWDRSLQVPMQGGHAYKVESALHYLFADYSREMPTGDGYTEWFDIAAWSDVLAFLVEQRERLRIGEVEPVTFPLTRVRPALAEVEARRQAKADEQAAKRHAWEQRQAERHAKNAEWNSSQVERLENFLLRLDDIGRLYGILVYDDLDSGQRMAVMYVSLPVNVAGCLDHDFPLFAERDLGRSISAFPSYRARHNDRRFLAEVRVHTDCIMLQPQDDLAESIPGAARVQELLLPFVARRGDRRGPQLMRLHRWMNASLNV
ncbi:GIY-YIG nuclease family protein, partial [Nitrincola lacisaponensis]